LNADRGVMRPPRAARLTVGFDSRAAWASFVNERPCSAHACASESGFSLRRRPPEVFAVPEISDRNISTLTT